jgi:hypothetical protein
MASRSPIAESGGLADPLKRLNLRPDPGLHSAVTTDGEAGPGPAWLVFKLRQKDDTNF